MTSSHSMAAEILLAEDNPTDAELTIRALRKSGMGVEIMWVQDGEEALQFMQRSGKYAERTNGDPRLVLLDLKMPKVDGLEVLAKLKADPALCAIPVGNHDVERPAIGFGQKLRVTRQQLHRKAGRFREIHRPSLPARTVLDSDQSRARTGVIPRFRVRDR